MYNFRGMLTAIGENPAREGLLDTPNRAAKAMMFFTKGYEDSVSESVRNTIHIVGVQQYLWHVFYPLSHNHMRSVHGLGTRMLV